jgi:hypothetical protein
MNMATKLLLIRLKAPTENNQLIFFSEEKNFSQDQKINRKNNSWMCSDISEVPIMMAMKFPSTVMVLGVISKGGGGVMPPLFSKGLKKLCRGVRKGAA